MSQEDTVCYITKLTDIILTLIWLGICICMMAFVIVIFIAFLSISIKIMFTGGI